MKGEVDMFSVYRLIRFRGFLSPGSTPLIRWQAAGSLLLAVLSLNHPLADRRRRHRTNGESSGSLDSRQSEKRQLSSEISTDIAAPSVRQSICRLNDHPRRRCGVFRCPFPQIWAKMNGKGCSPLLLSFLCSFASDRPVGRGF